jgi:radical SAM superfamily enzyme YgiQ (UPF0313 family)
VDLNDRDKMKLALVSVDRVESLPPLGLCYLASYLRKYGSFNNTVIVDKEDQIKRIRKEKPDVVGISSATQDFMVAKELATKIKSEFDLPTIIGGYHITALPHTLPQCFDMGVIGEGEQILLELVRLFESCGEFPVEKLKKIESLAFHDNGVMVTKRRSIIEPLDSIPYPARDLLKMKEYYLKPARLTYDKLSIGTSIITSRGCPYNCVFCSQTGFWQHTYRMNSPEYIVGEIKELLKNYKLQIIRIMDDLFIGNKERIRKISLLIQKEGINEKVEFHVYGRSNLIDEEMCQLLKNMNVNYMNFGLESGSDKVLGYLKKNTVTVEDHKRALALCGKYDIKADASIIFGSPNETREDMYKTFELIRNENLKSVMVFKLTPLPASALWDTAKTDGLVSDDMDWELLHARFGDKYLYLGKEMSKEDFLKLVPIISNEINIKNHTRMLKIKPQYLLNPGLIKRFLSNWKGFSKELINRIYHATLNKL